MRSEVLVTGASYAAARTDLMASMGPGAQRRRALVTLSDRWLAQVFAACGGPGVGSALVAVGGYGRGELAPGSDLDLLLLHPADADVSAVSAVADQLWYPVWDSGVRLDHSVRAPAQARRLAAQDIKVLLGLLDARTVAGDDSLTRSLRETVLTDWRAFARDRIDELLLSVQERTARSGELPHLLEPDLKDSHGGLRDLTALRAVAASWVADAPVAALTPHRDLLLDVRDALHQSTGRSSDRLLQQEQSPVADLLGLADADQLLRSVSAAGRAIAVASDTTWHRVQRQVRHRPSLRSPLSGVARRLRSSKPDRAPLTDGVVVQDGEAVLAVDAHPQSDPTLVIRAAAATAQAGLRLAPHAVDRMCQDRPTMPTPWPAAARDALVSLLGAGRSAIPVWEALDQGGLWGAIIPEWEPIRSAPQRNPVHRFTVDRHLLETAVAASAYTRRVARPDLLLVGALLHDIGKGRPGDHTDNGIELVQTIVPALGFDADDTETITALVRHHLLLPETATRRDLDDPSTISHVALAVGSVDVLDLLHALTEADAAATGPAAWSDWKKSLIDELVARTNAVLVGQPRVQPTQTTAAQRALSRAMAALGEDGLHVVLDEDSSDGTATAIVAAPDRTGLLATVAGVLAVNRLQVRAAQVETVAGPDGPRAVQVWTVIPLYGEVPAVDRLREDLRRALSGSVDLTARLAARDEAYAVPNAPKPPPATVEVVPAASERATVLEVRAHDVPALLHRVARAIASADVSITAARVATLGSDVVDVFYLVDRAGLPLTQERAQTVKVTVLAELAD